MVINTAWFYALTSFDFKWSFSGISIINRLLLCELHWEYMLGFGLVPAIITGILPKYVAIAIMAFLTSIFIIMAILTTNENSSFPVIETNTLYKIDQDFGNCENCSNIVKPRCINKENILLDSEQLNKKQSLPIFKIVKLFNLLLLRLCNRLCRRKVKKKS